MNIVYKPEGCLIDDGGDMRQIIIRLLGRLIYYFLVLALYTLTASRCHEVNLIRLLHTRTITLFHPFKRLRTLAH
jgi:hypothetical protein